MHVFFSTMSSTESGRKMTQAVVNTGRAVASTSRVVGGALSQAKGALSVWWSTLTTPSPQAETAPVADGDFEVLEPSKDPKTETVNIENCCDTVLIKKDNSGTFVKVNTQEVIEKIANYSNLDKNSELAKVNNIDNVIDQNITNTNIASS